MAFFAIVWQALVGPPKGPCEKCGILGYQQQSIVDPLSPGLKMLCQKHHDEHDMRYTCSVCGAKTKYCIQEHRDDGGVFLIPFCEAHHRV